MLQNLLQKHTYEVVDGFIKIDNVKQDNYNYKRIKGDLEKVKECALEDEYCLGFTDDGLMKFYVDLEDLKPGTNNLYIHGQRLEEYLIKNDTNIPKKIHFIWFSKGKAFNMVNYIAVKSALYHNPGYQVYFHCDDTPKNNIYYDNLKNKVIINHITEPLSLNGHIFEYFQNKADFIRINILKDFGGIYLDTDVILLKNLDRFLHHHYVMGYERPNISEAANYFLCNAVIMSEPNNELLKEWIHIYNSSWGEDFIGWWMGHSVVVPSHLRKKYNYLMTLLPNFMFYPFLWDDLSILGDTDNHKSYNESYGVHLWDTESSKTNLLPNDINYFKNKKNAFVRLFSKHVEDLMDPEVFKIEEDNDDEFIIFKGMDSPGDDLQYCGGKSIEELKQLCRADTRCIGFNTIGFLKSKIDKSKLISFNKIGYTNCGNKDSVYIYKERYKA